MYIYIQVFDNSVYLLYKFFQFTIVDIVEVILFPIFHYSQLNEWVTYINFKNDISNTIFTLILPHLD